MKPFSGSEEVPSSTLSSFLRCISGSSLLRRRNTAVSLMRSMRCSELARARTSSTTASCGIAKRSPAASTIRAETMAKVNGILMVTEEPSPATDLMSMVPPIWSILVRTTSMPTPRPETEVTVAAVEFGVGAVHLELDLLAEFAGEVADDAGQLLPGVADRLHPRLHDAFLQFGSNVGEPLQRHLELGVLVAAGDFQKLVAGQHQLGDHGHQVFERVDVDADRLVGDLVGFLDLGVGSRGFGFLGRLCL